MNALAEVIAWGMVALLCGLVVAAFLLVIFVARAAARFIKED